MCVDAHRGQKTASGISSAMLPALFLRQAFSLAWSSHTELCCLANDPLSVFASLVLALQAWTSTAGFGSWVLGTEFRSTKDTLH